MDDLISQILLTMAGALLELVLEFAGEAIVVLLLRAGRKLFTTLLAANQVLSILLIALLGVALGFSSVSLFPHPLVHPSRYHGISLVLSPLMAGAVMAQVGRLVRSRGAEPVANESFGYGFVLALSMALVRFVMVR